MSFNGFPYNELTNKSIGYALGVHRESGFGFLGVIYEEDLARECRKLGYHRLSRE